MKNTLVLLLAFFTLDAFAVCSSPISRTNAGTNTVLTSTRYNADLNTVYNRVNTLPGDCVSDASIATAKLIDSSVTTAKINDGAVTFAKLAAGAIGNEVIVSTSSSGTIAAGTTIEYVDATAGNITRNLPTAVGITGKKYTLIKTDATFNTVTWLPAGSETIGGSASKKGYTKREKWVIVSDGANWLVESHSAVTDWAAATTFQIGATTTAPTYGTATMTRNAFTWMRSGKQVCAKWDMVRGAAGTATAGSGDYLLPLPTGITLDTTVFVVDADAQGIGIDTRNSRSGAFIIVSNTNLITQGYLSPYSTTAFTMNGRQGFYDDNTVSATSYGTVSSGMVAFNTPTRYNLLAEGCFPAGNWEE